MRSALVLVVLLAACSPARPDVDPDGPFVALASDFASFRDWPFVDLPPSSLTMSHGTGARRLYFNAVPESDEAPFPLGAMLVKTVETDDPATWEIHAMVKRGGGYNEAGARGWEFFDLAIDASGEVIVRWRGEGPPPGAAGYPGSGSGDGQCNGCHALVPERDFVFDRALF